MRVNNWSLLVKPTHDCNLNCEYCYDAPFRKKYKGKRISNEILEHIAKLASDYAENVNWIWHGGEPTLMGVEWYREVQEIFYKHFNTCFKQSMQSNGILLDESWARLMHDYGIEIGMSFDVDSQLIREGSGNKDFGSNFEIFKKYKSHLGTITVINSQNYFKMIDYYEFFKSINHKNAAFNHIYRSEGAVKNNLELDVPKYIEEFKKYYIHWLQDTSMGAFEERSASEATRQVVGNRGVCCTKSDCRHAWIGVNPVGGIYPCDRFVPDKYYMGNIMDYNSIEELYKTQGFLRYYFEIQERMDTICKDCGYFCYCEGGCNANHIAVNGSADKIDELSCNIFKEKFNLVYDILRQKDFYRESFNNAFLKLLLEHPIFSTNEIKIFLREIGYTKDLQYCNSGKELLDSIEFKIFRIFNVFKGKINGHVDYSDYHMPQDVIVNSSLKLEVFRSERMDMIRRIYDKNKLQIDELLKQNDRLVE